MGSGSMHNEEEINQDALFPEDSVAHLIDEQLNKVEEELLKRNISRNIGLLYTLPHPFAIEVQKRFLDKDPNHLGNWSTPEAKPFATQILEREVIRKMINLYQGKPGNYEGYITSGATEGNLYCAWLGKKFLQ